MRSIREFSHASGDTPKDVDVNQLVRMAAELARSEYKYDAELALDLGLGKLTISTRADEEGGVCIAVSDMGTGIPIEHQARIFEPFFTTKPRGVGTGQGLALVQAMAHRHSGRVVFQTSPGEGTTFTISLPRRAPSAAA